MFLVQVQIQGVAAIENKLVVSGVVTPLFPKQLKIFHLSFSPVSNNLRGLFLQSSDSPLKRSSVPTFLLVSPDNEFFYFFCCFVIFSCPEQAARLFLDGKERPRTRRWNKNGLKFFSIVYKAPNKIFKPFKI